MSEVAGAPVWCRDLVLGPIKVSLLTSLLCTTFFRSYLGHPIPTAHLPLCFAKLLSRFLHDKNSREFLYYRKKVAEIRKEAQKLQAAFQKGKWVEDVGGSGEVCGQSTPHVESGFLEACRTWGGADGPVLCPLRWPGHCLPHQWSEVGKSLRAKVKVIIMFWSSALCF